MKKTIIFCLLLISTMAFSQSRYRNVALDTAANQVNDGYTNIGIMNFGYVGSSRVWIKFYDTKTKPTSVSVPTLTYQINSATLIPPGLTDDVNGRITFTNGLWIKCTAGITDTSTAQPASKPLIEIFY